MKLRQLKVIRNQNKLTQQQVADVLGISRSAYCGYETGRRSPDIDTLMSLSKFYGISLEKFIGKIPANYVYDDEFVESQPQAHYMAQLSKEETDLIINLRLSSDETKKEVYNLAKTKTNRKSI